MIHHVLAVDYDGTLATDGVVDEATNQVLDRLRASGRKLVLVTGRPLQSLLRAYRGLRRFACVVAENGALLYWPETAEEKPLEEGPKEEFLERLRERRVEPLEVGHVVVGTYTPHETTVLEVIRELGLEWQILFNKGAVMALPSGVNKAFGLRRALRELGYSEKNVVAVGDAENDESMLALCETSAAVANALPAVREHADLRLNGARGEGVAELVDRLLADDLEEIACRPDRGVVYGLDLADQPLHVQAFCESVLVVGSPGEGKSRFATSLWERIAEAGFQTCIVDPEGDYATMEKTIVIGTRSRRPSVEEALRVLDDPDKDCVVSLFRINAEERPAFFGRLLRAILEHRSRTGRPHWIIVDEAHYATPANWEPAEELDPESLRSLIFLSAFPDRLSSTVFESADLFVAISEDPLKTLRDCAARSGRGRALTAPRDDRGDHRALAWREAEGSARWFRRIPPRADTRRHLHHSFQGRLEEGSWFRFRGPDEQVDLPAQNLETFLHLARGVDDATWSHHLRAHDDSRWIRDVIKDDGLADEVRDVERTQSDSPARSRELIVEKIREHYDTSA